MNNVEPSRVTCSLMLACATCWIYGRPAMADEACGELLLGVGGAIPLAEQH